jgi:release factor glutamine methyltransferase
MTQLIKYIVAKTYKPLLEKYLSGTSQYSFQNIRLEIPPEVFHPGFFFSTKLLLRFLSRLPLSNKTLLELGAGSGLISIYAAQKGAKVTASDINPVAIATLRKNRAQNNIELMVIESDLFTAIPLQAFDLIVINPPYYKKAPVTLKDYAWYCGENGEFFQKLFAGLHQYMHATSGVLMVVSDGCDLEMIKQMAATHSFMLNCVQTSRNLVEKNFIYTIKKLK